MRKLKRCWAEIYNAIGQKELGLIRNCRVLVWVTEIYEPKNLTRTRIIICASPSERHVRRQIPSYMSRIDVKKEVEYEATGCFDGLLEVWE
jgi:hypothetical protein